MISEVYPQAGEVPVDGVLTQNPDSLGPAAALWLNQKSGTLTTMHVFGGPAAVSDSTVNAAEVAAGRTP